MTDQTANEDEETKRLVVSITDFLRDQLRNRTDLIPEDKDGLEIAIQCLEIAYNLDDGGYVPHRNSRTLTDIFNQVTNPVSVRDKIRADAHKDEGNNYMRRSMFENAETEYSNAIELDKWNSIYYCNRAGARIEQSSLFEAIADCRQALMLNPDYAKAHSRMGQAYALMNRPREAAQCFRQALELEPENESYRNNLRVAENDITRIPDVAQAFSNLIGSLFGIGTPNAEDRSSRALPASFVIITENRPPTSGTSSQIHETAANSQIAQNISVNVNGEQRHDSLTTNNINTMSSLRSYGGLDENSEGRCIFEYELPTANENNGNPQEEEIVINIPLFGFDFATPTQPVSSPSEVNSKNRDSMGQSLTGEIRSNVEDDVTLPSNTELESPDTSNEPHAVHKNNNDQTENFTQQELPVETNEKITKSEKKEGESVISNIKDSIKNNLNRVINNSNTSNNGLPSTEESRDSPTNVSSDVEGVNSSNQNSRNAHKATVENRDHNEGETSKKNVSLQDDEVD